MTKNILSSTMYARSRKINHDELCEYLSRTNIAQKAVAYKSVNGKIVEETYYYLTGTVIEKLDLIFKPKEEECILISSGGMSVRYILNEEQLPMFLAVDIARQLGYSDTSSMCRKLFDDDFIQGKFPGMNMNHIFLTESGLYSVILLSKKEEAKDFRKFVTHEVLPSIRRHGLYATPETVEQMLNDPDSMIQALEALKKEREKVKDLRNEVSIKQKVIDAYIEEVPVPDKRQVLNMVMRKSGKLFQERWSMLYSLFDKTYHRNTKQLVSNYNAKYSKKLSQLDYITDVMGMLNELYDIAISLFETDIKAITNKMFEISNAT